MGKSKPCFIFQWYNLHRCRFHPRWKADGGKCEVGVGDGEIVVMNHQSNEKQFEGEGEALGFLFPYLGEFMIQRISSSVSKFLI